MATTVNLKKILDRKTWEYCAPAPNSTANGTTVIRSKHIKQQFLNIASNTVHYIYQPEEDSWIQIPSGALAGTFGVGTCGTASSIGPTGTATAGGSSTITTNLSLARNLVGFKIHLTGGPGAGDIRTITSNTVGSSSVITVDTPFSDTPTTGTTYRLITPRFFVWNAGTMAAGSFRYYDYATNAWTSLSVTGVPGFWGTDGKLISTPSFIDNDFVTFATGTATAGGATTLTNSTKNWSSNQWTNYQVRIVSGTGAGQIRTITANTATQLTVATWTTNPSTDSVYAIEGNDDFLYLMGNNAVTLYRYSIAGNSWSTLSPTAARAAAPGSGASADWVYDDTSSSFTTENTIVNGSRIYSFRGGGGVNLDYYDIALNTWVSTITYSPATETFGAGSRYVYIKDFIYIQKDITGRWFRYDITNQNMEPWSIFLFPQGGAPVGDTSFYVTYTDGGTTLYYIHQVLGVSTTHLRCLIF
jgi:hypothetical protein